MSISTDTLELNKTAMFAKIRAGLPEEHQQTQNLLDCKDDLLYAWDSGESCLLVINWRAAQLKGFEAVKYQTLIPSTQQNFQVERVLTSNEGSLVALAGPRGVTVLELPRRWGQNGQFMEGKEKITCRSTNLDAHFFNNNPHLELRQLRWHPASPTDSHLLVLLSDNTIRVYDNATLRHVWQVGPIPRKHDIDPNASCPSAFSLGETAVDFDIGPAVQAESGSSENSLAGKDKDENVALNMSRLSLRRNSLNESSNRTTQKAERIEWPIIVLRENGNIYVLMSGLDAEKPRLQGPLTITPQTADNYGLDSCAILVIPSLPPTLVIAESNGKLHHALFLEAEYAENSFNEIDNSLLIHPSEYTIHVLETVELELGLPKASATTQAYNCPIHLKRDFINELRYFTYHNTGCHVVTVNYISELQRYLESDVISDIASLSTPSRAEYIVCTKIDTSERVNAVLGFVLLQMPARLILLLNSGQVISLKLLIEPKPLLFSCATKSHNKVANDAEVQAQLKEILAPSFIDHIKNLLQHSVTQPILSLDKSTHLTPEESYELLKQAIDVLRIQAKRHELVRAEFNKRINTIRLRKEQQQREIEDLENERELISEQAHRLAERFEEISDQHDVLTKKCQDLIRLANTCLPSNSVAEKDYAQEVERINKSTKALSSALQKTRESINKQSYHISKYNENTKNKSYELPEKQERAIKDILMQITVEIDGQIRDIKRISKFFNL